MIILVTDPFDATRTATLISAVQSSGLAVDATYDLGADPDVIDRYRLSDVPCIARIHNGRAVDLIADDWATGKSAATIKGRFTSAVNAYEAAKAPPAMMIAAERIAAIEAELAALKGLV